jgi:hypothetical protein
MDDFDYSCGSEEIQEIDKTAMTFGIGFFLGIMICGILLQMYYLAAMGGISACLFAWLRVMIFGWK